MKASRRIVAVISVGSIALGGLLVQAIAPAAATPAKATTSAAATAQTPAANPTSPFGTSINDTSDVSRVSSLLGRPLTTSRIFLSSIPSAWSRNPILATVPANGTVALSFQSGTPAQLQTFLTGRPYQTTCYVTYFHEPEDNFTTAAQKTAYLASWRTYAPAIRAAGCKPTSILMKWSLNPRSGRVWRDWFPAGDVDVLAFDAYNTRAKVGGYGIPDMYLAPILAASAETGLPWALTELGSDVPAGTAPSERAAWAHGVAVAAAAHPKFLFASWWDVLSPSGRDYTLDSTAAQVWHA